MSSKNTLFSYFKKVDKPVTPGREPAAAAEKKNEKASNEQENKAKNDENEKPKDSVSPPNKRTPKNAPSKESAKKKRKVDDEKNAREKGKKFKRIVSNGKIHTYINPNFGIQEKYIRLILQTHLMMKNQTRREKRLGVELTGSLRVKVKKKN